MVTDWSLGSSDGYFHIGHSGGMVGYRAYIEADMETGLGVVVLVNGPSDEVPWEPESMGHYALRLLRASRKGTDLPDPPIDRSNLIENAGDYAGVYHSGEKTFALSARDRHLILECDSDHAQLVRRGRDQFFVDHADLDRFLFPSVAEMAMSSKPFTAPTGTIEKAKPGRPLGLPTDMVSISRTLSLS